MKRLAAGCLAVMASSLAAGPALAADQILVLGVMINGRPTELLVEFVRRGAHLLTKASELRELGLKISADGDTLVEVDGLPGVTAQIDDLRQEIALTVANDALIPKVYATRQRRALPPVSPATWGLVANYKLSGNYVNGAAGASLDPDLRLSTPLGTLSGAATIVLQSGARSSASTWASDSVLGTRRACLADNILSVGSACTKPSRRAQRKNRLNTVRRRLAVVALVLAWRSAKYA
jgi:outer membrane usher protein FimD/PapC